MAFNPPTAPQDYFGTSASGAHYTQGITKSAAQQPHGLPQPPQMLNEFPAMMQQGANGGGGVIIPSGTGMQYVDPAAQQRSARARAISFRTEKKQILNGIGREDVVQPNNMGGHSPYARSSNVGDSDYEILRPAHTGEGHGTMGGKPLPFIALKDLNMAINTRIFPPLPQELAMLGVTDQEWKIFSSVRHFLSTLTCYRTDC